MLIKVRSKLFLIIITLFTLLTILVKYNFTSDLDNVVFNINRGNVIIDALMMIVSTTADITPFYLSPIIIISFILLIKRSTRREGALLLISLLVVMFISLQLKSLINRERPNYEFKSSIESKYLLETLNSNESYPSGHAARSMVFTYIIYHILSKKKAANLIWIYPCLVSISRVYLGVHYPTDVIGGALLGLIIASVFNSLFKTSN